MVDPSLGGVIDLVGLFFSGEVIRIDGFIRLNIFAVLPLNFQTIQGVLELRVSERERERERERELITLPKERDRERGS